MASDVLSQLPILTAIVWYVVVILQVARDHFRTWTEVSFLAGFFSGGTYALCDFLFFNAPDSDSAMLAARLSLSFLSFAILFYFIFGAVFLAKMRRIYFSSFIVNAIILWLIWTNLVITPRQLTNGAWIVVYDNLAFIVLLLYIVVLGTAGVTLTLKTTRIARQHSVAAGRRASGIFYILISVLVLGIFTNGLMGLLDVEMVPIFSSLLGLPGIATLYVLLPTSGSRISQAIRRWHSLRYEPKSAYLIHRDGTLVDFYSLEEETGLDKDLFSATLDVIQNFMRTSFPMLSGKWLRTIEHGDMKILIERGQWTYFALIITGEENDLLRMQMRENLKTFERNNATVLESWTGVVGTAKGTQEMLHHFFERPESRNQ